MSSFIGHSLAAVTIYLSSEPVIKREVSFRNNQAQIFNYLLSSDCLVILVDYYCFYS